jgi:PadR family transcriptional regulator, regulatory protein PadR
MLVHQGGIYCSSRPLQRESETSVRRGVPDRGVKVCLLLTCAPSCHLIRYRPGVIDLGMSKPSDLLQGTLDLLILRTLALEPMHGWAIAARIQQTSQEVLQITQGALYPALHRLEQQGWLRAKWRKTETGRDAKFYSLTAAGRAQLEKELAQWERLSGAVGLVIRMAEE